MSGEDRADTPQAAALVARRQVWQIGPVGVLNPAAADVSLSPPPIKWRTRSTGASPGVDKLMQKTYWFVARP
jgi:hypothetical protein